MATPASKPPAWAAGSLSESPSVEDIARFRQVIGQFCSGITVITAHLDGTNVGMTCQSFFSLSLDPLLVAFSPSRASTTYPSIRAAGAFAANILAEHQSETCTAFAVSGTDRWAGVGWTPGRTGSPILHDVVTSIECVIDAEHEAGDHFIVVGRVVEMHGPADRRPLLYHRGRYAALGTDDDR